MCIMVHICSMCISENIAVSYQILVHYPATFDGQFAFGLNLPILE